jgi:hypothetical protein
VSILNREVKSPVVRALVISVCLAVILGAAGTLVWAKIAVARDKAEAEKRIEDAKNAKWPYPVR